jgi:hypothetical protein
MICKLRPIIILTILRWPIELGAHPDAQLHVDSVSTHAPSDAIIVPDAHLLFNGDFKRSGVDLVLSNDDQELVLHDYFKGEKRVALASPDGAHLTGDIVNALTGHVEYARPTAAPAPARSSATSPSSPAPRPRSATASRSS